MSASTTESPPATAPSQYDPMAEAKAEEEHLVKEIEGIKDRFKINPDSITRSESLAVLRKLTPFRLAKVLKDLSITGDQKKIVLKLIESAPTSSKPIIGSLP